MRVDVCRCVSMCVDACRCVLPLLDYSHQVVAQSTDLVGIGIRMRIRMGLRDRDRNTAMRHLNADDNVTMFIDEVLTNKALGIGLGIEV